MTNESKMRSKEKSEKYIEMNKNESKLHVMDVAKAIVRGKYELYMPKLIEIISNQ